MALKTNRPLQFILLGLLAAGLLIVYFGTQVLPFTHRARAEEIGELEHRQLTLDGQLMQARRMAADMPRVEAVHARLAEQWEDAREMLPEEAEMACLLREITFRGQSGGVEFTLFKPLPAVPRTFYSEKPVEVRVEGGYHQVASCLNRLAQMDRIVHVTELEIERVAPNGLEEEGPAARAHFFVTAYVLGEAEMAAQQADEPARGLRGAVDRLVRGRHATAEAASRAGGGAGGSDE
ncbi:MAG: type 4a pilus biogenesis protein PilO [Candidatus Eisenbacteria sp.]|nr:type 4a pilus biogenesis protein PilO [Candidatus Eisenbacteria bacterium]